MKEIMWKNVYFFKCQTLGTRVKNGDFVAVKSYKEKGHHSLKSDAPDDNDDNNNDQLFLSQRAIWKWEGVQFTRKWK